MSTCVKVHIKKRKRSNEFQKVEDAEAVAVKVTVLWGRKTLPYKKAKALVRILTKVELMKLLQNKQMAYKAVFEPIQRVYVFHEQLPIFCGDQRNRPESACHTGR